METKTIYNSNDFMTVGEAREMLQGKSFWVRDTKSGSEYSIFATEHDERLNITVKVGAALIVSEKMLTGKVTKVGHPIKECFFSRAQVEALIATRP